MKNKFFGLCLILLFCHSNMAFSFNVSEIEQRLSEQVYKNPKAAYYQIEAFLTDTELPLSLKTKLMVMQSEISYFIDQPDSILKYSKSALATGLLVEPWYTRVLISQSRGYYQRGEFKEFFATANMAVNKAEQSNLLNYKIAALIERAFASHLLLDNDEAKKDLNLAVKYLDLLPNIFDKATILERFSAVNKRLGNIEIAKKYQHQAIDIYIKINSAHYLSVAYYNLGRIYQEVKDWQEASNLMLQSYRWALKDNNKLNQAFSLSRLSEFQSKLEKYQQSKKYLSEAIIAADASASERVKIHVRKNMANILCLNKDFKACESLLIATISFAKSFNMQLDQIELLRMLAEAYYQQGVFEKAYLTLKAANEI